MVNKYEWLRNVRTGNPHAQLLLLVMAQHNFKDGKIRFSNEQYAEQCCLSKRSIQRAMRILEEQKIVIRLSQKSKQQANTYTLNVQNIPQIEEYSQLDEVIDDGFYDDSSDYQSPLTEWHEQNKSELCELAVTNSHGGVSDSHPNSNLNIKNNVLVDRSTPSSDGKKTKTKRASQIHDDFMYNDSHIRMAQEFGIDIEQTRIEFIDYWKGVGKPMADWSAVFRNRLRQIKKWSSSINVKKPSYQKPLSAFDQFSQNFKSNRSTTRGAVYEQSAA